MGGVGPEPGGCVVSTEGLRGASVINDTGCCSGEDGEDGEDGDEGGSEVGEDGNEGGEEGGLPVRMGDFLFGGSEFGCENKAGGLLKAPPFLGDGVTSDVVVLGVDGGSIIGLGMRTCCDTFEGTGDTEDCRTRGGEGVVKDCEAAVDTGYG